MISLPYLRRRVLRIALYQVDRAPALTLSGQAERIGHPISRVRVTDAAGNPLLDRQGVLPDHNAAPVRAGICAGLEFLGIVLDPQRNEVHALLISRNGGPVTVRVLRTDEDMMMARHTSRLLWQRGKHAVFV